MYLDEPRLNPLGIPVNAITIRSMSVSGGLVRGWVPAFGIHPGTSPVLFMVCWNTHRRDELKLAAKKPRTSLEEAPLKRNGSCPRTVWPPSAKTATR